MYKNPQNNCVGAGPAWQPGAIKGNSLQSGGCRSRGGAGGGPRSGRAASGCLSAVVTSLVGALGQAGCWSGVWPPQATPMCPQLVGDGGMAFNLMISLHSCPHLLTEIDKSFPGKWGSSPSPKQLPLPAYLSILPPSSLTCALAHQPP